MLRDANAAAAKPMVVAVVRVRHKIRLFLVYDVMKCTEVRDIFRGRVDEMGANLYYCLFSSVCDPKMASGGCTKMMMTTREIVSLVWTISSTLFVLANPTLYPPTILY